MIIQVLISLFGFAAFGATLRRFKKGTIGRIEFVLWTVLWIAVVVLVWNPTVTNRVAGILGVGRGADAVFYVSIVLLFFAVFRLYGRLENLEHKLSELVKKIALKDLEK